MPTERHTRPPPRERTFAELFPWRNIRRAVMLVLLILAIVMLKRSAGTWSGRLTDMWGPPASGSTSSPTSPAAGGVHRIRVDPGPRSQIPATDTEPR